MMSGHFSGRPGKKKSFGRSHYVVFCVEKDVSDKATADICYTEGAGNKFQQLVCIYRTTHFIFFTNMNLDASGSRSETPGKF
jgi:hypothetical protein